MKAAVVLVVALAAISTAHACFVEVGGVRSSYDYCEPIAAPGMRIAYTLEPGSKPGTTLFKGFLKSLQSTGFAAFGWTQTRKMNDTDAVVLAVARGQITAHGYKIRGYTPADVNGAKGTIDIGDAVAGRAPDGSIATSFTMELEGTPEEVAGVARAYNYVFGGSVAFDGTLAGHNGGVSGNLTQVGSGTITLQYAGSAASGPATALVPAPVPVLAVVKPAVVPSPAPLPTTPVEPGPIPVPTPVAPPIPVPVMATAPPTSAATISGAAMAVIACAVTVALQAMTEGL